LGETEHVDFGGAPLQVNCIAPEKPAAGVATKSNVELSPAWTAAEVCDVDRVKPAGVVLDPELHCATGVHAARGPVRSFLTKVMDPVTVTLLAPPRLMFPPELNTALPPGSTKNVTISPGPSEL
jgi:hypothetical protein